MSGSRGTIFLEQARVLSQLAYDAEQFVLRLAAPKCAAYASCESTRACSRKMVPRLPLMPERARGSPGKLAQHFCERRHPHRDAVAHLVADDRLRPVGHIRGDLDAAVHRLRMHHDRIRP